MTDENLCFATNKSEEASKILELKSEWSNSSRRTRWAGHVARMGAKRNAYRIFGGKARGKETTGKTKT
jgi:hypothetical protein